MKLQEQVTNDWKEAMKARDPKKDTLSLIRTELKNKAINGRSSADEGTVVADDVAMDVLMKMAKQRRESIEQYQAAGRDDLVKKEQAELSVIESYLPKALSDEALAEMVQAVIAETGASGQKDMGKVMGAMMARAKGQADGNRIQNIVRQHLSA